MLQATAIRFARGERLVLDMVDLTAHTGEVVGVIGPNGSGKTTLLRTLFAALNPLGGAVVVDGSPLESLSRREVAQRVAVVAQEGDPEIPITVSELVMLGRLPHRAALARPKDSDRAIVSDALASVGAGHLADVRVRALSGGEKQRVLIARALAQQAGHLLLDEPTNHLDIRFQHDTLRLVRSLPATTVLVLHDLNLAAAYCDSLVLLDHGRVVSSGPASQVLTPATLEPVYGIGVRRIESDGQLHLMFAPAPPVPPDGSNPVPIRSNRKEVPCPH